MTSKTLCTLVSAMFGVGALLCTAAGAGADPPPPSPTIAIAPGEVVPTVEAPPMAIAPGEVVPTAAAPPSQPPRFVPTFPCWGHRVEIGKTCPLLPPGPYDWRPCPQSPGVDTLDGVCPKP